MRLAIRQGSLLDTAAGCGCKLGSKAAQGRCSGCLVKWGMLDRWAWLLAWLPDVVECLRLSLVVLAQGLF